jgi:hypothetical protein
VYRLQNKEWLVLNFKYARRRCSYKFRFKNIAGAGTSRGNIFYYSFFMINFLKQKPLSRAERRRQRRLAKQVKLPKNWGITKTK